MERDFLYGRLILTVFVSVILVTTVFALNTSEVEEETEDLLTGEIPEIDREQPDDHRTAIFGVWCFWGPDSSVGVLDGVIRTRVGYWEVKDSTHDESGIIREALKVDYDPEKVSYMEIYQRVFETGQYKELHPFGEFVLADINQQSFRLGQYEDLNDGYQELYPELQDFINSTAIARTNGYLFGHGELDSIQDLEGLGLTQRGMEKVYEVWESRQDSS